MFMKRLALGMAASAITFALAPLASAATVIPVGSPKFFITNGTPTSPSISAIFWDSFADTTTAFDDQFTFTIPQRGVGSGSISTSFSDPLNKLTITDLIINGVPYMVPANASGQSTSVGGVPITANILNTIEVKGFTVGANGFSGTATFTASVPEPATWALMIAGFGALGFAMRRRRMSIKYA
jgi:hypothetical protein